MVAVVVIVSRRQYRRGKDRHPGPEHVQCHPCACFSSSCSSSFDFVVVYTRSIVVTNGPVGDIIYKRIPRVENSNVCSLSLLLT